MKFNSRIVFGILIVLIGLAILSTNLGFYEFDTSLIISTAISIFIMLLGLRVVFNRSGLFGAIFGIVITLVGFNMFNDEFNLIEFDSALIWKIIWPIVIILVGIKFIFNFKESTKVAIFSGVTLGDENWKPENNTYTAVFGGFDIDLSDADIAEGVTEIKLSAVFGGMDVIVPTNVNIICKGKVIFGGIEFFNKSAGGIISTLNKEHNVNSSKTVVLDCDVAFGGIEVKAKQPHIIK